MFSSLITPAMSRKCESVHADVQFAKPDLQAISDRMYELIQAYPITNRPLRRGNSR